MANALPGAYEDQAQLFYVAYYGRPADPAGLQYWAGVIEAAGNLSAVAEQFGDSAEAVANYGSLSHVAAVNKLYQQMFGRNAEPDGLLYWVGQLDAGNLELSEIPLQLYIGAQGSDLTVLQNKLAVANALTGALDTTEEMLAYDGMEAMADAAALLSTVGVSAQSVQDALAQVDDVIAGIVSPPPVGATFVLTTGIDDLTGGAGNDVFVGNDATGNITLTTFDKIDGGDGYDTLRMDVNTNVASLSPYDGVIENVEKAIINAQGTITGDLSAWQGLEDLVTSSRGAQTITAAANLETMTLVNDPGTNGNITVNGGGGVLNVVTGTGATSAVSVGATAVANGFTSASVTGGTTVSIQDRSGAAAATGATLTSVALDGNVGAATLTANGLTTLSLSNLGNAAADVTVTAAAGERNLDVTLDNVDNAGIEVRDNTATSFTVTTAGTAADVTGTLHFHAATQGTVTANGTATLNAASIHLINGGSTLNFAGDAAVTVGTLESGSFNSGLVIDSANTAGVTITAALANDKTFHGGDGADSIGLAATTKAHTLGGGNDTVALSVGALGVGGSIDGGADYDTLAMSAANAATLTAAAVTKITGFEQLNIGAVANGTTTVIGLDNLNAANANSVAYVQSAGVGTANPGAGEVDTVTISSTLSISQSVTIGGVTVKAVGSA